MDREKYIKKQLSKVSRQSFWLGVLLGVLIGLTLGFAIGYSRVGTTVVIPLTQGIRT